MKTVNTHLQQNVCNDHQKLPYTACVTSFDPHPFIICPGDSGGPIVANNLHHMFQVSVISLTDTQCINSDPATIFYKRIAITSRLEPSAAWILHTIDANSADHALEAQMNSYSVFPHLLSQLWANL